jgi:hypothetical protein
MIMLATADVHADAVRTETRTGKGDRNNFSFKADRTMIGAELEVCTSTGERILAQKVKRRRVSVDFSEVGFGEYIIRITATGNKQLEYRFLKK